MGWPEMAEKHKNPATQVCGYRCLRRPDPGAFDGGWPENFTGVVVLLLHLRRVYSSGGRNRLPRLKPDRPKNGSKRPSSGFSGFFGIFSLVLGLDPHLAPKTRLIWSLWLFSGKKSRADLKTYKILLFELTRTITSYP